MQPEYEMYVDGTPVSLAPFEHWSWWHKDRIKLLSACLSGDELAKLALKDWYEEHNFKLKESSNNV